MRKELLMEAAAYVKALKQDGLLCGWSEVGGGGARRVRKAVKGQILRGLAGQVKTFVFVPKVMGNY